MTISKCYVWKWLKSETTPVVAGVLSIDGDQQSFAYGRKYLEREDAEPIYAAELALSSGTKSPISGMKNFSCLRDSSPDAWGRRVINARLLSKDERETDLTEIVYLMNSASDRIGSLDFQKSNTEYIPRETDSATLDDLFRASLVVGEGGIIPPDLDSALFHGSSIGGARPKAMINDGEFKYIAKFSASDDTYDVVKSEFVAMKLAALSGINVADIKMMESCGKDVLLVKRFDRDKVDNGWIRKSIVSGLTVLGLDEAWASEASYENLLEEIRLNSIDFNKDSNELFSRMAFNVLIGNTDDHARNHAFYVRGDKIELTPAYDICPQRRTGGEASHGMKMHGDIRRSQINVCVNAAKNFGISKSAAIEIISNQITIIHGNFELVCDEINVPEVTRRLLMGRTIFNDFIFYDGYESLNPKSTRN
ncbi:MAG: HipA domain-containing protein [Labilibaculum sp.]|nr:HipA domain-containing protein [Labilibaculum sp.]